MNSNVTLRFSLPQPSVSFPVIFVDVIGSLAILPIINQAVSYLDQEKTCYSGYG